ncbi:MAG TPA: inositol 2-dehydrogenase [Burkholderiales bacterium]|nr:inositol 2-dehydrogenase [Burkholderiales bacterium]HSA71504.1 inositol 2-dehydrogenase [Burkholderiales bacterium]
MVNFALFGAGRIGRMHAENLAQRSDARLLYVVDTKPEAARALAEPLGARQAAAEEAFSDPQVHAVLIASSTGSHADLSIAAARAGKAIFCEKPVDLTLPKVDLCIKEVRKARVPMFVGFNRRFDPSFRELKKRLDAGVIGKLEQVIITNRDPGLPELRFLASSGGLFLDFTIHDFDMARWLLGEEPVEVFAWGAVLVDPRVRTEGKDIDTAMLLLRTASGKMCHINNTRRAVYGYDQRIEVLGAKGMLRAANLAPTSVERFGAEATCVDNPWPNFQTRYAAAYAAELSSFIRGVEARKPVEVGPEDSRQVLVLAEAALKSSQTGRPVRLK